MAELIPRLSAQILIAYLNYPYVASIYFYVNLLLYNTNNKINYNFLI